MFAEFKLNTGAKSTLGYHWAPQEPKYVMCLVHGICEYAGRYDRMAQMLSGEGIAVISMDLRGHGGSSGKRGHCAPRAEILEDISRILECAGEQYHDLPLILYGHSFGGNLVLDYRARGEHRLTVDAYIISAPWLMLKRRVSGPLYGIVKSIAKVKPDFTISAGIKPELLGNPQIVYSENRGALLHNQISVRAAMDGFDIGKALLSKPLEVELEGEERPMLLMHGTADQICDIEGTRQFAAMQGERCTYIEWPALYHEIHNGNLDQDGSEVIRTMISWIKGQHL